MWKSNFGRPTPSTRRCVRDRVNTSHWLISTQVERQKKIVARARRIKAKRWGKKTAKQKRDYADRMSKLGGGSGTLSLQQHRQLEKLVKVNSRRESSRCILVELVATPSTRRASETRATHPSFPCAGIWSV